MIGAIITILTVLFVIDAVLLVIGVLLHVGGGAEAGIFGSASSLSPFGAKSSEMLGKIVRILGITFITLALLIGILKAKERYITLKPKPAPVTTEEQQTVPQPPPAQQPSPIIPVPTNE